MKYKAIIFDMDGTLLDTVADIGEATNRVLAMKNLPQHPTENYKLFVGEGARRLIERALPDNEQSETMIADCLELFFDEYTNTWDNNTKLYPGIEKLLNSLADLSVTFSILSNKPESFTKACTAEYLEKWNFFRVMGNSDQIPHKPDPTGANSIAADLKVKQEEILFVGDTKIDMKTAKEAGMTSVGVLWGFRPKEELVAAGADHLIHHPLELLTLL